MPRGLPTRRWVLNLSAAPVRSAHRTGRSSRLLSGGQPRLGLRCAPLDPDELVGGDREPGANLAVRPLDADSGGARRAETDVGPAELTASVTAVDGQLASECRFAELDFDPGADGVAVGTG